MQLLSHKSKLSILAVIGFLTSLSYAMDTTHFPFCQAEFRKQNQMEASLIYTKPNIPKAVPERIQYFSQLFLNKPYVLTALGEGEQGEFDQAPLYRFDAFDCQTYVETVLALTVSQSAQSFKDNIDRIRYAQGKVDYLNRHHFTSPDWNASNQQQGWLRDITATIVDQNHQAITRYAQTTIDPANWYQHFEQNKIRICGSSEDFNQQQLQQLRNRGKALPKKPSRIAYLPIQALTTKDKNSQYLLDQIPSGTLIEIVRPNWDLTKEIGTHLNVSHMGFAIREHGILYFYQASSLENKVIKIPLEDYLISMLSKPTIQGINVQVIL